MVNRIEQYKKLFDLIMRLVVVYSVEKIRIRNKFAEEVFDWYQQTDHQILNSADRQVWWWYGQKLDHPLANRDLRDRVVYELRRYFGTIISLVLNRIILVFLTI